MRYAILNISCCCVHTCLTFLPVRHTLGRNADAGRGDSMDPKEPSGLAHPSLVLHTKFQIPPRLRRGDPMGRLILQRSASRDTLQCFHTLLLPRRTLSALFPRQTIDRCDSLWAGSAGVLEVHHGLGGSVSTPGFEKIQWLSR